MAKSVTGGHSAWRKKRPSASTCEAQKRSSDDRHFEGKRGRFSQTKRRARPRASTQFSARIKRKGKAAFMNNCLALFENQNLQELASFL